MRKVLAVFCGALLVLPVVPALASADPVADAVARDLGISAVDARARLVQQDRAHVVSDGLRVSDAGRWFDATSGRLTVAVTRAEDASVVRAAGAEAVLVSRSAAQLSALVSRVKALGHSFRSVGVDVRRNDVVVSVVGSFPALDGVRVVQVSQPFVQQSGEVNPGDPWWPGSESNCSVGFPAVDSSGGKHFVTAGHCTNDVSQAAYGESGQRNRIGTSNAGGGRSVNAREGDMGVVAVTESGWTVSPVVNTWGSPAVTVTGSKDALVGEAVCHSGNTAPQFECGVVNSVNQTVDYGSVVIDGLTLTTACSQGGDSGGAWLAGSSAVGLHSGGQSSCSPGSTGDNSIFQPVNEALTKWNLTLVVGSGSGDVEPPTAPTGLRSVGATSTGVSLEWTAASDNVGVTGYDVLSGSTVVASVAGTSASVSGLTPDTSYSFTVVARDAAGNVSKQSDAVSVRTQPGSGGERTFSNGEDYPIRDFQVAVSRVVSTASGAAAASVTVQVDATHTCSQDLNITLVGPSGRSYPLQRYGGYPCTAFQPKAFTARVSERAAGTWTLRIGDNGPSDVGLLSGWSVTV
ncbi:proprotein convertase P-domain-containing protein [Lentzea sp. NPDC051838]|uniref:proprotein convertase P-domain-containing protein n=1 Tax=Lentzea sp. NPDC051838 TaxID=3154849 RepID=UPI0034315E98